MRRDKIQFLNFPPNKPMICHNNALLTKTKKNLSAIISNGRKLRKRLNYGNVEQQFELSDNDGFF